MSDLKPACPPVHIKVCAYGTISQFIVTLPSGKIKPSEPGEVDNICQQLRNWLLDSWAE